MDSALKTRKRRKISQDDEPSILESNFENQVDDIEVYSKEIIDALIEANLPITPNNFSLYFDRLLEDKSDSFRKQIKTILELEDSNEAESAISLEQSLKHAFNTIKNILGVTANLYKNISLMTKILDKRKKELEGNKSLQESVNVASLLENDISKLNSIFKKQSSNMKNLYDETAKIVKNVENETIFDNQFGVYNKRYLMQKIEAEIGFIKEFKHKSSLIMIELCKKLKDDVQNEKALILMTRTIARLLLKTSRRSDIVAHYGNGRFSMLLKYTDIESAKKASERLCDLVANSNFFFGDKEIHLKIAIGITDINPVFSVEEIIVSALDGIEKAYTMDDVDFVVSTKEIPKIIEEQK